MRILNVICSLDPSHGGPVDGAINLAALWRARGHEVYFATLDSPAAAYVAEHGAAIHPLGSIGAPRRLLRRGFLGRVGLSNRIVPWLRRYRSNYDIVVVHALWNFATLASRVALADQHVPYVVFPHGTLDPWFARAYPNKHRVKRLLWPLNEGKLLNNADAVLFTTQEERALASDIFQPYRLAGEVVGFGSSDVPFEPSLALRAWSEAFPAPAGRRYLLFLSRIHPKKGCDLLIRAFARVTNEHPDLDLVVAGPDHVGWQRELSVLTKELGIEARVHWTGMIEGAAKWGALLGAEAFVLPSHSENFGVVVAEALACGVPVLITDKVNLWREVEAEGAGLVGPDTQDGIDKLLRDYLTGSPAKKDMLSSSARRCFDRHFRFETAADTMLALFQHIVSRHDHS